MNRLLLATVGEILRTSKVPPIIILQGDHGTKLLRRHRIPRRGARCRRDAARERFGAFGAYYLPDGGAEAFGDTVTVVNVLGNVLRYYFGAQLPRRATSSTSLPRSSPYAFRRVDARWLAGDESAGPGLRAGS